MPRKPMTVTAFGVMPLRSTTRQAASDRPRRPAGPGSISSSVLMAFPP